MNSRTDRLSRILAAPEGDSSRDAVREHDLYQDGLPYEEDMLPDLAPAFIEIEDGLHPKRNDPHHMNDSLIR